MRHQRGPLRIRLDLDPPARAADSPRAHVAALLDPLDPGDGAAGEEREHAGEVVRRAVLEPHPAPAGRAARLAAPARRRGRAEPLAERGVEAPHAPEAARERDLRQRERRVVEEPLREGEAARLRERLRADAELGLHRPAQVTIGDAEGGRERRRRPLVEVPGLDARDRGAGERRRPIGRGGAGRELRPAPEAGAEAPGLRLGRRAEEAAPRSARAPRRADGPAVDPGRRHAHEEQAVEAAVPGGEGAKAGGVVELHDA